MAKAPETDNSAVSADRARVKEKFLTRLRENPNISAASRAANIDRQTAYNWREIDPEFKAAWEDALEQAVDDLEEKAWNRAADTSDRMMEIMLKAHRPDKYVEKRRLELTGADGGPIESKDVGKMTDAEVEQELKKRLG